MTHIITPEVRAGTYYDSLYDKDTIKIGYEEGKLLIKNRNNRELIPVSETTYRSVGYFANLVFTRNEDGTVAGFKFQTLEPTAFKKIDVQ